MLLIKGGVVVTMNQKRDICHNWAIAVDGQKILEMDGIEVLSAKYPQAKVIDAQDKLVIPGLVNAHTHLYQVMYRGLGDDVTLVDWLEKCIWPMSLNLTAEDSYAAAQLAIMEMLKSGTTTFVDSHYINKDLACNDRIAQAVTETGIRGVLVRGAVDTAPTPEPLRESVDLARKEASRIIETYHGGADGRLSVRVEPLNEVLASPQMIKAMKEVSTHYGVGLNMHVAESPERTKALTKKLGMSPIKYLNSLGVLGEDVLFAHCCWVDDEDLQLLYDTGTKIVHNPISNQYLADGVAPVPKMLAKGLTVAMGPDGAASNNNHDMFGVMKGAALLHKVHNLNPMAITAEKIFEMATIDGAKAIGKEKEIGSLEVGKKADVVLIDLNHPSMVPMFKVISNLVYAATPSVVDTVIVDGKIVVENKKLVTINETQALTQINRAAIALAKRSGLIN